MAIRKGRGILLENVSEEHALRIAAELEKDGIRARLVSREQLPPMPAPAKALALERGGEFLSYQLSTAVSGNVVWDAISVASCGVVARPAYKDLFPAVPLQVVPAFRTLEGTERDVVRENMILKLTSPPPAADGRAKKRKPESLFDDIDDTYGTKVHVYLDLVTSDLATWLRVPMNEASYVPVAGNVKMGGSWGFRLLVRDILERCPAAATEMTLKLLDAADIKELVFPQVEEFSRVTAWSAIKRYLWPSVDSSPPSPAPPGPSTDGGSSNASPGPGPSSTSP
jgi:hypothetical protein